MSAATCHESLQDEAAEILRCLHEALRHRGIATALVLLVSGKKQGEEDDFAVPAAEAK